MADYKTKKRNPFLNYKKLAETSRVARVSKKVSKKPLAPNAFNMSILPNGQMLSEYDLAASRSNTNAEVIWSR